MRYTIEHQGVPVGIVEVTPGAELTAADVQPLPGYAAIQPLVRSATDALRNLGFIGPVAEPASSARGADALAAAGSLGRRLELRDERGAVVAVDAIDLTDWPGSESEVVAFISFGDASATVPAPVQPPPVQDRDGSRPDVYG
jgi:hypothetical protein